MADASLGKAVLRTQLDTTGLKAGLSQAKSEVQAGTRSISADLVKITAGVTAAGAALFAARGLVNGSRAYAVEAERAANSIIIFNKQVARSGVDSREAAVMVDRLATRFGVLPQVVEDATTLILRAGGNLQDTERLLTAAGASSAAVGFDIATSFDNAATAVATGRSELLETSGIVANLGPVTQQYAKSLGKTVEQLTQQELVQARVNAIYDESKSEIEDVDQLLGGFIGTQSELKTETAELRQELGRRALPVFKAVTGALADGLRVFNDLPQPIKTATTGVALFGGAGATLLTTVAGLKVALSALGPAFIGVRAAMLPFLGPAGILAGAVAGYLLLNSAMHAGRAERQQALQDSNDLIRSMGAYRDQLVITSEEERKQLIASLERRKQALERVLQMQQAYVSSLEADVIAFANKGFFGQLFGFGEANVNIDALDKADQTLANVQAELDAIDTQLGEARTMDITPNVTVPTPVELGDDYDAFGLPVDGSTRVVEIQANVARSVQDRLRAEADLGGDPFGRSGANMRALLQQREEQVAAEWADIRSEAWRREVLKHYKFETDTAVLAFDQNPGAARVGLSANRAADDFEETLDDLSRAGRAAATAQRDAAASIQRSQFNQALGRIPTFRPSARLQAFDENPGAAIVGRITASQTRSIVALDGYTTTLEALARAGRTEGVKQNRAMADLTAAIDARRVALARSRIPTFQPSARLQAFDENPGAALGGVAILPDGSRFSGLGSRDRARGDGGLAEAQRIFEEQQNAANQFSETVVNAGFAMGDAAIQAVKDGDIPGLIRAGLSGAGSILGGANLGSIPFLGGSIGVGGLIAGGIGLLGTLIGGLAGGASDADRAAEQARRLSSAPAININFTVQQSNTYNGAPRDPANEQAFARQADKLFEAIYRRHLGPRLERIEHRLGITGA